jgi:hypothetical protein
VTTSGSTSSASTPKEAEESIQEKLKPRPNFLPEDIKEFMKKIEEEVCPVDMEVDVVIVEGAGRGRTSCSD